MRFSVVIPVFNEADNIRPLLAELCAVLHSEDDFEIIYVNDGSDDQTMAELEKMRASICRLRVLTHPQRYGQSSALLSGIKAAHGKWIITMDGDGQNDPADVPILLQRMRNAEKPEQLMLVGHRMVRADNWVRRVSSRIANSVRSFILTDGTPDTGCSLKIFSRQAFLSLPAFDHMHRFLPALMKREGVQIESISVHHRQRSKGASKYGVRNRLWVGIMDMFGVLWLQQRQMDQVTDANSIWARLVDYFGVRWLQKRPCHAIVEERS